MAGDFQKKNAILISKLRKADRSYASRDYHILLLERRAFLGVLYCCLPDRSKVLPNKQVIAITEDEKSVSVTLQDGSIEKGDMNLDCEGVHSITRNLMWDKVNKTAAERERK